MNKNIKLTAILSSDLVALAQKLGFETLEQAGFVKIFGGNDRFCYISRTKACTRIDLAHFTMEDGDLVTDSDDPRGGVKQILRFDHEDPNTIVENFGKVLMYMRSLPQRQTKAASKKEEAKAKGPTAASVDISAVLARLNGVEVGPTRTEIDEAAAESDTSLLSDEDAELERLTAPDTSDSDELTEAEEERLDAMREKRGVSESVSHSA